ncbi:MAG: hypothetical protein N4J56_004433 [Chroococcidiopsis sp. SAG 2025]|jgi:hypothetical protein|nr:hypothetical protein [Chroococcidiopsis sp. SAG 2025]
MQSTAVLVLSPLVLLELLKVEGFYARLTTTSLSQTRAEIFFELGFVKIATDED